jgi:hypothetical protein
MLNNLFSLFPFSFPFVFAFARPANCPLARPFSFWDNRDPLPRANRLGHEKSEGLSYRVRRMWRRPYSAFWKKKPAARNKHNVT